MPSNEITVLIVEDNPDLLSVVSYALETDGYKVYKARNASEGLDIVNLDVRIDVIFTDVMMPGTLSSIEMVNAAKILRPNIKFIFTSGFSNTSEILVGAPILLKPFQISQLEEAIKNALS